ncbi:hypothetical protein [Rhodococcus sp. IEGM 1379]|uniref:hypothetical protein n=1 Tax=Rhodococcus sp. IEGM 1379 TaxID=3047086 RepID=UPI0024B695EE|nr:hypothetical protein [Rhodococcus sp. IEGM 1379]MDI9914349.1 hypothetical protein [Rhodococcus sp. IEGM 1379]
MDVYGKAQQLLNELTAKLETTRAGQVDYAAVHPGDIVPAYGCETAFVRPGRIWPTTAFPNQLNPAQTDLTQPVSYAADLEVVVYRCYGFTEKNEMPELSELDSLARDALDDARAMMRAVQCAFDRGTPVSVSPWMPRGPSGGIHGGSLTVTVGVELWCPCDAVIPEFDSVFAPIEGDPRIE